MTSQDNQNQDNSRAFKGIWIPAEIWLHPGLSLIEKTMWAEIDSLSNPECFASNAYLQEFFGLGERRVQEIISKLRSLGLVVEVGFNGRCRRLKAVHPCAAVQDRGAEKCTPGVQKSAPLPCGKVHPENKAYIKEEILPPTHIATPREEGRKEDSFEKKKSGETTWEGVTLPNKIWHEILELRGGKEELKKVIDDVQKKSSKIIKNWDNVLRTWKVSPPTDEEKEKENVAWAKEIVRRFDLSTTFDVRLMNSIKTGKRILFIQSKLGQGHGTINEFELKSEDFKESVERKLGLRRDDE